MGKINHILGKPYLFFYLLGLVFFACQGGKQESVDSQKSSFSYASPEGVISDGNHYYVSNVGDHLDPMKKDADGFILKVDKNMNIVEVFSGAEKLNAPKAMVIEGDVLYVTDIDRVIGLDMHSGTKLSEFEFQDFGLSFISGIAMKDSTTFYICARDENMIIEVQTRAGEYVVLPIRDLRRPNSVFYYHPRKELWVVEDGMNGEPNGRILKINTESYDYQVVEDFEGVFYGMTVMIENILLITDINTKSLHKVDMNANTVTRIDIGDLSIPSSLYYDDSTGTLIGARSREDSLVQVSIRHLE